MDNTLHSFSSAYRQAIGEVFREIVSKYPGLKKESLASAYQEIQRTAEVKAFVEKKTSFQYRRERFDTLLQRFGIKDAVFVKHLARLYGSRIEATMKVNPNVHGILSRLKKSYGLCLVSEGPSDAQRRSLKILGLEPFFSHVFISSEAGKAKENGGLFRHALKQLGCSPNQVVHVGDSFRDIVGANKTGIKVVWFNPKGSKLPKGLPKPIMEARSIQAIEKAIVSQF